MDSTTEINPSTLDSLVGQMVGYMTGAAVCAGVVLGDQLGLYRAMADGAARSADAIAASAGCHARLTREWLDGQASAGLVNYDPAADTYALGPEAAMVLANEDSPAFLAGGVAIFQAIFDAMPKLVDAFAGDGALAWGDHHPSMYRAVARFFRPGYHTNLMSTWIPALEGVATKLVAGGSVADVGCGFGHSCFAIADAFPRARISGFDFHEPSISEARASADQSGLGDQVRFEVQSARSYQGPFDLICFFDCLHDMGDPVGIARHAREQLSADGSILLVEPFALPSRQENIIGNPAAPLFYHTSTMVCTPCSLAQDVGRGLGGQSGEDTMRSIMTEAGYQTFRVAHISPFNIVYEAKA